MYVSASLRGRRMSKKKHIVLCLGTVEYKQLKIICDERKIEIDEFIGIALENEIQRIFNGNKE